MRLLTNSGNPNIIHRMNAIVFFLLLFTMHGLAQNPLLGIGNKVCHMNDGAAAITTQDLPTPAACCSYNESSSMRAF
jgi:hypothetical protein